MSQQGPRWQGPFLIGEIPRPSSSDLESRLKPGNNMYAGHTPGFLLATLFTIVIPVIQYDFDGDRDLGCAVSLWFGYLHVYVFTETNRFDFSESINTRSIIAYCSRR